MDRVNRNPGQKFDGSELDWLLDEYLNAKASKVAAPTLKDYSIALGYFRKWWSEVGPQQGNVLCPACFWRCSDLLRTSRLMALLSVLISFL